MIPVALNVRNFMSYTDVHEPLRFDGIHVAVLTGDNGHGKSALLDAITWALWGRARAKSVDELIHTGASEMEVEFEFQLDGEHYRVIRKRQRRGRYGTSDLQFAIADASGSFKPLTERSVAETERLIQRTLRMSYETFTSSSFIQQGRADSFTTNSPAERKRVLAEILELGYYDELEARAKDRYKRCEAQLGDERRLAQEWDQEIAKRPTYQAEADRLRAELASLDERVEQLDVQTALARERLAALDALHRQVQDLDARIQRLDAERTRCQTSLAERRGHRQQAQAVLGRAAAIEQAAAELDQLRQALEQMTQRQHEAAPLERAREVALRTLATEQARLEAEVAQREQRLAELRTIAGRLGALRADLRRLQQAADTLSQLEAQHRDLQVTTGHCREDAAEKRTVNAHLKQQMLDLRERIDELQTLATCPTCQRPMDASHKQRLQAEYARQGSSLRDQFRTHEAAYKELEATVARHEHQLAELAKGLVGREDTQRRLAQAESAVAQATEAHTQLTALEPELAQRRTFLQEQQFAPAARRELAELQARIAHIGYDEAGYRDLRARAAALQGADRERHLLDQARLVAEHLDAQIAELDASLARLDGERATDQQRRDQLALETQTLPAERERLGQLELAQREARRCRDEARQQWHAAQNKLDNCVFIERKRRESLARQDALRREQSIYGDLATAFGRKGMQAMIIETAIPEIEDEANRLLARMTDGRMHVKLETQRDQRTGTGTIETLDIKISDELGTRSYELFSGGEGFRVNFAIRIALSRLLAHRAGTRLQTLVLDEGMGSQDQEGRDRIVEAIQAIGPDFEKILVVTHLEDLRDRFPVRIEVAKTPHGSTYSIR